MFHFLNIMNKSSLKDIDLEGLQVFEENKVWSMMFPAAWLLHAVVIFYILQASPPIYSYLKHGRIRWRSNLSDTVPADEPKSWMVRKDCFAPRLPDVWRLRHHRECDSFPALSHAVLSVPLPWSWTPGSSFSLWFWNVMHFELEWAPKHSQWKRDHWILRRWSTVCGRRDISSRDEQDYLCLLQYLQSV